MPRKKNLPVSQPTNDNEPRKLADESDPLSFLPEGSYLRPASARPTASQGQQPPTTPVPSPLPDAAPDISFEDWVADLAEEQRRRLQNQTPTAAQITPESLEPFIILSTTTHYIFTAMAKLIQKHSTKYSNVKKIDLPVEDLDPLKRKLELTALAELIREAERLRRKLAVETVNNKDLSRVEAAQLLGLHQGTIAKWIKDDEPPSVDPTNGSTNT